MNTAIQTPDAVTGELTDTLWATLYLLLHPLAKRWVYSAHIYSWIGQENDVAWDIVLVTIQRTYEYTLKAQHENIPIASIQRLSITIAKNYFQDLRRKDSRLQPFNRDGYSQVDYAIHDEIDTAEAVLEKMHEEWLFQEIAKEIANYPPKMRMAMLIDIAMRMDFGSNPTPLQAAFIAVGIQLQDFQNLLPEDPVMRSRHASLVSLGYRKLAMLFRTRESCAMVMKIAHDRVWNFRTSVSYP
jgi:DNA-directed RNA polymerase specialized sigma24 family protein